MTEILDIVNENDEVIGQIERSHPDKEKHMVRVVFVGFYTPDGQLILQRRGPNKKGAGKLTTTVSGHVESGWSYDDTAVKESSEETGVTVDPSKLHFLGTFPTDVMRAVYAYPFTGEVTTLEVEVGEGDGFVAMHIDTLQHEITHSPDLFTPFFQTKAAVALIDYIKSVSASSSP